MVGCFQVSEGRLDELVVDLLVENKDNPGRQPAACRQLRWKRLEEATFEKSMTNVVVGTHVARSGVILAKEGTYVTPSV
jgi:hypothetical protein